MKNKLFHFLVKPTHIAPLVILRMAFGAIMFISILRFIANGWVYELYVEPKLYFPYYGFEWLSPFSEPIMYLIFGALAISFLFQCLGLFYRISSLFSFTAFTYIELLDKSNYLNHYYFVSIICFLLIFVPANKYFSLDILRNPKLKRTHVPHFFIFIFQLQLAIVYFYAGLAKLNYDWLINAMPLKIWLPSKSNLPLIGIWLKEEWVAYLFSWFGALYDLSIPFLLFIRRTRWIGYLMVIVFHVLTYWLFQIGMFPFIMIVATLIFFSTDFHKKLISFFTSNSAPTNSTDSTPKINTRYLLPFFTLFILLQLLIPFRFLAYPGNLYWTEQGYRFSWRVMLMEKAGYAIFHVTDNESNRTWEVNNYNFLSPTQEKMMSTQPDMILQFAHHLESYYHKKGIYDPKITAEVYVALNGRPSQLFIDPNVDLTKIEDTFANKTWILSPK